MSNSESRNVEKPLSDLKITDSIETESIAPDSATAGDKVVRPSSSLSSATEDSFHSADEEDESNANSSPQHRLGSENLTEDLSPSHQVIEPDGLDGPVSDSTPSDEADFINGMKPKETPDNEEEEEEEFLNEEYLKDLELSMSEEEKNEKREESQKHKESGNVYFKDGKYSDAVSAYTAGLRICPVSFPKDRAILFSNRAAAKAKMDMKKEAIKDCSKAIDLHEVYTKAILRRATLNEETDQLDEALQDFKRVLELDPYNQEASQAVRPDQKVKSQIPVEQMLILRLPDMINERNEKLKEEMMGKLKDLGNMILRPFGLSTNNFELKQDSNTGGYNINFKQNG